MLVTYEVEDKFRLVSRHFRQTRGQGRAAFLPEFPANDSQRRLGHQTVHYGIKRGERLSAIAAGLQDADKEVHGPFLLGGGRQAVTPGIVETDHMQVPHIGIGHREMAARLYAADLEHQPLVAAETADIALTAGQRAVDDTHNLIGFIRLRVEGIIGIRTLEHDDLVGIVDAGGPFVGFCIQCRTDLRQHPA